MFCGIIYEKKVNVTLILAFGRFNCPWGVTVGTIFAVWKVLPNTAFTLGCSFSSETNMGTKISYHPLPCRFEIIYYYFADAGRRNGDSL